MNIIGHQNILIKINILENKLNNIESKIDIILKLLQENKVDCEKMSLHIDFINKIYEKVRLPMDFICNNINNRLIKN